MSCGEKTLHGSWYYAASRQRYGCGAHIQIEANGKCVVAETDDYGPDVCVENAAGRPIIDASPLVSRASVRHAVGGLERSLRDSRDAGREDDAARAVRRAAAAAAELAAAARSARR